MRIAAPVASLVTFLLIILLFAPSPPRSHAQDGRVLRLTEYDSAKAKRLHAALVLARDEWDEFNGTVKREYTETPYPPAEGEWRVFDSATQRWYEDGWAAGFHYDEEYHYILEGSPNDE